MSKILKAVKIVSKGMRKGCRCSVQIIGQTLTFTDFDYVLAIGLQENQENELKYSSVAEYELNVAQEGLSPLPRIGFDHVAKDLVNALEWCAIATDNESSRYALGGVCWDGLHIVGTDGRRMHVVRVGETDNKAQDLQAIIPSRVIGQVSQLVKLFKEDTLSVKITEREVVFSGDCWRLLARLVEGRFPRWKQIAQPIERNGDCNLVNVATLSEQIAQTVKRVQLENKIAIEGMNAKSRKSFEPKVPQVTIADNTLDARYLGDALQIVGEEMIEYRQADCKYGALHFGESNIVGTNERFATLAVIMPMSE